MDWTDSDEAGHYVVPNVLSPRGLVSRPDNMDETVQHIYLVKYIKYVRQTELSVLSQKVATQSP